jgi:NADH dehydrogenase (ubiquinone) 1 beta subcomplex subunit 9
MASTAGYLARRAAQKERVRLLYRRALKDTLNWAVHRHLFYQDVSSSPSASLSILIWISI